MKPQSLAGQDDLERIKQLGSVSATQDATSLKYIPQTATEFTNLGLTAPNAIYRFQEASGNVTDYVGTASLTASGTGMTYRVSTGGWASYGISWINAASGSLISTDTSLPDTGSQSVLTIVYAKLSAVSSSRAIIGYGTTAATRVGVYSPLAGTPTIGLTAAGSLGASIAGIAGYAAVGTGGSVVAYVFKHDVSRGVDIAYTDSEMVIGPIGLADAAGKQITIGNTATQNLSGGVYTILYAASWYATAAEMSDAQIKSMLTTLGWATTWTATGTTGVAVDATSNMMVPANIGQWWQVARASGIPNFGPPNSLYLCQEASGNLADTLASSSTATLTAAGTPLYNQAVPGWTRTAASFVEATAGQKFSGTVGQPLLSANSVLLIGYIYFSTTPAATRSVMLTGTATAQVAYIMSSPVGVIRGTSGVNGTSSAFSVVGGVHPVVIKYDRTNSICTVYTDQEIISVAYTAGTTGGLYFGGQTTAFGGGVLYAAQFTGKAAEITDTQVKTLLQTLGWTVAWTGASTRDTTSGKAIPQTAAEYTTMGLTAPNAIYRFQEVSGNILDYVGTAPLVASGSATYQTVVTGWTTKSLASASGGTWFGTSTDASLPDTGSQSVLTIIYAKVGAVSAGNRSFLGYGTTGTLVRPGLESSLTGTPLVSLVACGSGGSNNTSTAVYPTSTGPGTVVAYVFKHDVSRGIDAVYTDVDLIAGPICLGAAAGKQVTLNWGAQNGLAGGTFNFMYAASWYGTAAEMSDVQIKAMLLSLGWATTWSATANTVSTDATSGYKVPNTLGEWWQFSRAAGITGFGVPNSLWLCQEASGSLVDSIAPGNLSSLTGVGSPSYSVSVPGWSRKSFGLTDGANQYFLQTTGIPTLSVDSVMVIGYLYVSTAPAALRNAITLGSSTAEYALLQATTGAIEGRAGAGAVAPGASSTVGVVVPIILKYDRTNSSLSVYTNVEKVSPPFTAGTFNGITLGGVVNSFGGGFLYVAQFTGKAAEITDAQVRTLLQNLGWPVAWGGTATQDATSSKYIPQVTSEYTSMGLTTPNAIYRFQEVSGDIVDYGAGTATLTMTGTGSTYRAAVTGWASKALAMTGNTSWAATTTDVNLPDTGSQSFMTVFYATLGALGTSSKSILGIGAGASASRPGVISQFGGPVATPAIALQAASSLGAYGTTTSSTYPPATGAPASVVAYVFKHDISRGVDVIYTGNDIIVGPINLTGAAGKQFSIGSSAVAGFATSTCSILYAATWYGAAAEKSDAQIKLMISMLGFNTTWSATDTSAIAADATSTIKVPNNVGQWWQFVRNANIPNLGVPNSLYLCQEAAGDLTDTLVTGSTATLTAAGTPLYNQAVTGWTRTAASFTDGTVGQKFTGTTGQPPLSSNSVMVLGYMYVSTAPGGVRSALISGTATAQRVNLQTTTGAVQGQTGANTINGASSTVGSTVPVILKYDNTNSVVTVYTNAEKVTPVPFTAGTSAGLYLGGQVAAFGGGFVYVAQFTGKSAELTDAQIRTLLQGLGWTVAW